jgi:hypothetical protein
MPYTDRKLELKVKSSMAQTVSSRLCINRPSKPGRLTAGCVCQGIKISARIILTTRDLAFIHCLWNTTPMVDATPLYVYALVWHNRIEQLPPPHKIQSNYTWHYAHKQSVTLAFAQITLEDRISNGTHIKRKAEWRCIIKKVQTAAKWWWYQEGQDRCYHDVLRHLGSGQSKSQAYDT